MTQAATPDQTMTQTGSVTPVDPATAQQWLKSSEAVLVDVREPVEHAGESIPGSTLVPSGQVSVDKMPEHTGRKLIVHCKSGGRSTKACDKLAAAGLEVYNMTGGIEAWRAAGLETKVDRKAPIDLVRQVHITVGLMVFVFSVIAAVTGNLWFLVVPIFFGGGLLFAGLSGFCGLAMVLSRMPWNRVPTTSCKIS